MSTLNMFALQFNSKFYFSAGSLLYCPLARHHSYFLCFWPLAKCNWRPMM